MRPVREASTFGGTGFGGFIGRGMGIMGGASELPQKTHVGYQMVDLAPHCLHWPKLMVLPPGAAATVMSLDPSWLSFVMSDRRSSNYPLPEAALNIVPPRDRTGRGAGQQIGSNLASSEEQHPR